MIAFASYASVNCLFSPFFRACCRVSYEPVEKEQHVGHMLSVFAPAGLIYTFLTHKRGSSAAMLPPPFTPPALGTVFIIARHALRNRTGHEMARRWSAKERRQSRVQQRQARLFTGADVPHAEN